MFYRTKNVTCTPYGYFVLKYDMMNISHQQACTSRGLNPGPDCQANTLFMRPPLTSSDLEYNAKWEIGKLFVNAYTIGWRQNGEIQIHDSLKK